MLKLPYKVHRYIKGEWEECLVVMYKKYVGLSFRECEARQMWCKWVFDGIGTEIVSLVIGTIIGIVGDRVYMKNKNKQSQNAGDNSIQMQFNTQNVKDKVSTNMVSGNQTSLVGDYISGDKVINAMDEFDIGNFSKYSNTQIEEVISRGNDATVRRWCLELIVNEKPDYLIKQCLEKMHNEKEKYNLLEELVKRGYQASEYCRCIDNSMKNGAYQTRAIELYLSKQLFGFVKPIFININNNEYIYKCLTMVYSVNRELFKELYDKGMCFSNQKYNKKIKIWLKQQTM